VRTFIEPNLPGLNWETRLQTLRGTKRRSDGRYALSLTGIYGMLGIACLVLAWALVGRSTPELVSMAIATVVLGGSTLAVSVQCRRAFSDGCHSAYNEAWESIAEQESDES
jgi:hypothetical protein